MQGLYTPFVSAKQAARTCRVQRQCGLQVVCRESRVGRVSIPVPKGVTVTLTGNHLKVKIDNAKLPGEKMIKFKAIDEERESLAQHGLSRALANNMVVGASKGFEKRMEMFGTGYRAAVAGTELQLSCGYSKPRNIPIPPGIKVKVEKQTMIIISGADNVMLGDFCATVRRQRPPEPYKGKGIRWEGEVIKLKEGKAAAGKKK